MFIPIRHQPQPRFTRPVNISQGVKSYLHISEELRDMAVQHIIYSSIVVTDHAFWG